MLIECRAHNSLDIVLSCFRISWIRFSLPSHEVSSHFISVTMTNNFSLQFQVTVYPWRAAKAETSTSCSPHICSPVQRKKLAHLLAYAQGHFPVITQFRTLCLANSAVGWIIPNLLTWLQLKFHKHKTTSQLNVKNSSMRHFPHGIPGCVLWTTTTKLISSSFV